MSPGIECRSNSNVSNDCIAVLAIALAFCRLWRRVGKINAAVDPHRNPAHRADARKVMAVGNFQVVHVERAGMALVIMNGCNDLDRAATHRRITLAVPVAVHDDGKMLAGRGWRLIAVCKCSNRPQDAAQAEDDANIPEHTATVTTPADSKMVAGHEHEGWMKGCHVFAPLGKTADPEHGKRMLNMVPRPIWLST